MGQFEGFIPIYVLLSDVHCTYMLIIVSSIPPIPAERRLEIIYDGLALLPRSIRRVSLHSLSPSPSLILYRGGGGEVCRLGLKR